ncbi:hypothetical protein AAC387_Pa08g1535 [Persea americana]
MTLKLLRNGVKAPSDAVVIELNRLQNQLKDLESSLFLIPEHLEGKSHPLPGKRIFLSEEELHAAHTYILFNCEEIDDFVRSYDDKLKANQSGITDKDIQLSRDLNFALWLKDKALNDVSIPSNVQVQAMGPDRDQVRRNGYKSLDPDELADAVATAAQQETDDEARLDDNA